MRPLDELLNLSGRRALITGGAGQLAEAAAESLLEAGASVTLLDIDEGRCKARAHELSARFDREVPVLGCDLAENEAVLEAIGSVQKTMGGLEIVVHCAGLVGLTPMEGWAVPFGEQSAEAFEYSMRVNVASAFTIVQCARSALVSSGKGSVILFSSIYGLVGPDPSLYEGTDLENPVAYGAAKGAIRQLTRYLATTLAPAVRVNSISPGGVLRDQDERFVQRYSARTPLGRMAGAEDVKGAVAFLASDLSEYVTGHDLVVDGGWTAW